MVNKFTVSATESYGFPPDPIQISFETFPFIPPKLALVDYGISTATGDNIIRPGVVVTVQARVQNTGQGEAEGSAFSINLPTGVYFSPDSRQNYTFSSLKPGEFKDLEFSFTPSKKVGKTINLAIGFTEESSSGKFPLNASCVVDSKRCSYLREIFNETHAASRIHKDAFSFREFPLRRMPPQRFEKMHLSSGKFNLNACCLIDSKRCV